MSVNDAYRDGVKVSRLVSHCSIMVLCSTNLNLRFRTHKLFELSFSSGLRKTNFHSEFEISFLKSSFHSAKIKYHLPSLFFHLLNVGLNICRSISIVKSTTQR